MASLLFILGTLLGAFILVKLVPIVKSWSILRTQPGWLTLPMLAGLIVPEGKYNYQPVSQWKHKYNKYEKARSTALFLPSMTSPQMTIYLADAETIQEICSLPATFKKPFWIYRILTFFGTNLVVSDEDWKRHRKVVGPAFGETTNEVVWNDTIAICSEWFHKIDTSSEIKNEKPYSFPSNATTMILTLLIMASAGFGRKIPWPDADNREAPSMNHKNNFLEVLVGMFQNKTMALKAFLPSFILRLPFKIFQETLCYFEEFEDEMRRMIQERREERALGVEKKDLLSSLVKASDSEDEKAASLTELELLSNVHVFFFAGHETTAHTITSFLLLLSLYPEHQTPLFEEGKAVLGDDESPPFSAFSQLSLTTATVLETLRIFPSVTPIPKIADVDAHMTIHRTSETGELVPSRVFVPQGTMIVLDVPGVQYSPHYWDNPFEFRPSRFIDTPDYAWPRNGLITFSAGRRGCIGRGFALTELTVVLALVVRKYVISPASELIEEFKLRPNETERERRDRLFEPFHAGTLAPSEKLRFAFTPRNSKSTL